jgi:hypothetical protein
MYSVIAWVADLIADLDRARRYGRALPELPGNHDEADLRRFAGIADLPDDAA